MLAVDEQYWTMDEVAERLKVSRRTINRLAASGALPVIRIAAQSGAVRVAESDLRRFLEERRTRPPNEPPKD